MSTENPFTPEKIRFDGEQARITNSKLVRQLKQKTPKDLDNKIHEAHDEAFSKIDCLDCANCCKTTSPVFTHTDVDRISKRLKMKPGVFTETYLTMDIDDYMVLKTAPCAFLSDDNSCSIYTDRPSACKTYPHTNRKKMYQLLDLTLENSFVCPAVQSIMNKLASIYIKSA